MAELTIYTVGHSNHPYAELREALTSHGVESVVDVRAFPASRRWPQFNREPLRDALAADGIAYHWLADLGGRRGRVRHDSPHRAWTVAGFRNYADYMDTPEFASALAHLISLARERPLAYLCAEALYWQCHRRLISDRLLVEGYEVRHILGPGPTRPHQLPPFARIVGGRLIYDGNTQLDLV